MDAANGKAPFSVNLLSSGAKAMNVNGSVTPVVYSYSPGGSIANGIHGISVVLADDGSSPFNQFGALGSALTNGILIQAVQSGNTYTIANVKDNGDLTTHFQLNNLGSPAVLSILGITTPVGFGNTTTAFIGEMILREPLFLYASDVLKVTIRDNLTGISILHMCAHGFIQI